MRKKVVISVIILLVLGIITSRFFGSKIAKKGDAVIVLSPTDVIKVQQGIVGDAIAFTGELLPLNQSIISSEVDAQVVQVLVKEAQFVKKDQVLAILDDTDLQQAVNGQNALLATALAKFELDKIKLERQKELFNQGFISKIAYDELLTNYQSSLEAVNQQKAALQRARKQLSHTIIKAPLTGYVYQKNIDVGQLASKNGKLFAIASLDMMQIKAAIPSDYINKVKLSQIVNFKVGTDNKIYAGKVTRLNPVAEINTRSYYIYIDFSNKEYNLKAGQFVKGQIVLSSIDDAKYIPSDSVRSLPNGDKYILVINNGVVTKTPIKVLIKNNVDNVSAISGVEVGAMVIVGSVMTVKPGDKVQLLE